MKIVLSQKELSRKLSLLTKMPMIKKNAIDFMGHVFFRVEGNHVKIMMYDGYEIFATSCIESMIDNKEEDEVIFNTELKLLSSIVNKLTGNIEFELTDSYLKVRSKGSTFELFIVDLVDMWKGVKKLEIEEKCNVYEINQLKLRNMLELVMLSASQDKEKTVLSSIRINTNKDEIELIGTDGYRASIAKEKLKLLSGDMDLIECLMPVSVIPMINRLLISDKSIKLYISGDVIGFETDDLSLYIRTCSVEKYPDVKGILKSESENILYVNRKEWLNAVDTISKLGADLVQIISPGESLKMTISGESDTIQNYYGSGAIEVSVDREKANNLRMLFRNKLLLEGIKSMKEDLIEIRYKGENDFITIRPKNVINKVHIVLPCRSRRN